MRSDGLSAEEADAIETFAAEVRAGMATATPLVRRQLYERLRVRGTVRLATALDRKAIRLGRLHRYCIDWTTAISLLDRYNSFLKIKTQHSRSV